MEALEAGLKAAAPSLTALDLGHNTFGSRGGSVVARLFENPGCSLKDVDLQWNKIQGQGAVELGLALGKNDSVTRLDLSYNGLGPKGAQFVSEGLSHNVALTFLDLSANGVDATATFVLAEALEANEDLALLILDNNPLGVDGARAMLRLYAGGEEDTTVRIDDCNFDAETIGATLFDPSEPAGEYALDLDASALDRATAATILSACDTRPGCELAKGLYYETSETGKKGAPRTIKFIRDTDVDPDEHIGRTLDADTGAPWEVPDSGTLVLTVVYLPHPPRRCQLFSDKALERLLQVVFTPSATRRQREQMITFACVDMFFEATQVQEILGRISEPGERLHGLSQLIPRIMDSERRASMLKTTTNAMEHSKISAHLGAEFVFLPANPTGHYRLDMSRTADRNVYCRLIEMNNHDSAYARLRSGRGDTSEQQNWSNFRNTFCEFLFNFCLFGVLALSLYPLPHTHVANTYWYSFSLSLSLSLSFFIQTWVRWCISRRCGLCRRLG